MAILTSQAMLWSGEFLSVKKLRLRRRVCFAISGVYLLLSCPAMAGPTVLSGRSGAVVASYESPISKLEKIDNKQFAVGVVDVNAELEKIWDVLADYDNAPLVFDNLKLCQCVGKKGNTKFVRQVVEPGAALKFDYTVAFSSCAYAGSEIAKAQIQQGLGMRMEASDFFIFTIPNDEGLLQLN